jgi:23S rRNA (cytosine1962-C5)-methyltransferase
MTVSEISAGPAPAAADVPVLRLKRGEDRRLTAGHLWVFSNEVDTAATPLTRFQPGDPVQVHSDRHRFLGYGYVNPQSLIAARLLSRNPHQPVDQSLLVQRLQVAHSLRRRLFEQPFYRLVHGESDGLPGLVVDRYDQTLVAQIGTAGMERLKPQIVQALVKVMQPRGILWRNDSGARELEGLSAYVEPAFGEIPDALTVQENGLTFSVPLGGGLSGGQKTGWFFDQSANRQAFLKYIPGARVLDVFSYVGAWGLAALKHGATEVTCVDGSQPALDALEANAARNAVKVETIKGDAFDVLERLHEQKQRFDVVVLDPPAFIKRRKDSPKGQAAYRRLNQLGLQLLSRDGLLVSCSCSYHLQEAELLAAIQKASRQAGRTVQVLEFGGQAPDHPVHPAIAETRYLKAFFCRAVQD